MDSSVRLNDHNSEAVVLASLMESSITIDQVNEVLESADFADSRNQIIYTAVCYLEARRQPIDVVGIESHLSAAGEDFGGIQYIGSLIRNTVRVNVMAHVRLIKELSRLRRLVFAIRKAEASLSNDTPPAQQAEECAEIILSAISQSGDEDGKLLHEIGGEWLTHLQEIYEAGGEITGLSTGFPDLDKATRGLHGGELIILAARPAMGKSVFAMNLAANAAKQGHAVYVASLEMPRLELMSRLAAAEAGVDYGLVQSADLVEIGPRLQGFVGGIKDRKLMIDDRANMSVPRLRASLKRFKRKVGSLDLVVIDYLQLLTSTGSGIYEKVSEISRALKVLAMELNVPIICLSQLNRELEKRPNKRPQLSDLRDSGSLEQDANAVLFLYREAAYTENLDNPWVAELIIAKLRHGRTGTIPLIEQFNHCRFLSADPSALPENWRAMVAKPDRSLSSARFTPEWTPSRAS